jgi:tRNA A37 threonylcarbamoyladenosine synthetase subunit TsaC/SUA5/YrdC
VARYFDVHPDNPQSRTIGQVVELIRADGLVAYPTDSCYALGCQLDNKEGLDRIRRSDNSTANITSLWYAQTSISLADSSTSTM